jgi:hypothetical protein
LQVDKWRLAEGTDSNGRGWRETAGDSGQRLSIEEKNEEYAPSRDLLGYEMDIAGKDN